MTGEFVFFTILALFQVVKAPFPFERGAYKLLLDIFLTKYKSQNRYMYVYYATIIIGSEAGNTDTSNTKDEKDLGTMSQEELMKLAAAQADSEGKGPEQGMLSALPSGAVVNTPGQLPQIPLTGPHIFPGHHPMIPPPMIIQPPPFHGTPIPPNMLPPGAPPPNIAGVPPPNMGGYPVHQLNPSGAPLDSAPNGPAGSQLNHVRPQEGGQFPSDNTRAPESGQYPPQFLGRPQPGRPEDGEPFPPNAKDEGQALPPHSGDHFAPHHPGRHQGSAHFTPHRPGRPHDGGKFPPRLHGRYPDGPFPPMHRGPPPFHPRPPRYPRMPAFHPGGPRFSHDIPSLLPSGGPPRGPDFGHSAWGLGPGPMRGPPLRGPPPPHWADNRPPDEISNRETVEDWNKEPGKETESEMNPVVSGESLEQRGEERDFGRRNARELKDQEPEHPREQTRERRRDREDPGRDREDRLRNDRFWDRGRDREWERVDRRHERDERDYRSNRDLVDGNRGAPRRRSRFEPLEEKPVAGEPVVNKNELQPSEDVNPRAQDNGDKQASQQKDGEIVQGTENKLESNVKTDASVNSARDNDNLNMSVSSETVDMPQDNKTMDNLDVSMRIEATDINMEDNKLLPTQSAADSAPKLVNQEASDNGETAHSIS